MQKKDKLILGLIFTRGISLKIWEKVGNLEREIKPYIELAKSINEIYFFTYGGKYDSGYQNSLPQNIKIIPKPSYIPTFLYVFLMPIIKSQYFRKIDVIKTNQMDGSWAGVIAKILFKKKLIIRCGYEWLDFIIQGRRGWLKIQIARVVESLSYNSADAIIITSEVDKKFISDTFSVSPSKINVVPNYIDIHHFRSQPIEKVSGRIIFVGRLEPQKNILAFVESLKGLNVNLVMAGAGSMKREIINTANMDGISIEFLGNVPQSALPIELAKSEIYVLPSLYEGNPKTLLEAMACGVACVGSNAKGISNVIHDGETGLLADPTPAGLREKIKLLLENKDQRDRLGANARQQIVREQSLEAIIEKELKIYEQLL